MVNNNFSLIGTIISDFEKIVEKDDIVIYQTEIEVEKAKIGSVAHFLVRTFGGSKSIDYAKNYKGKLVALGGYLDVTYQPNASPLVTLVCTSWKVLGVGDGNNTTQRNTTEN